MFQYSLPKVSVPLPFVQQNNIAIRTFPDYPGADVIQRMDIKHIRLHNLKTLISRYGTAKALAEAADTNPKYISQIINERAYKDSEKTRGMGDILARKFETNLGLEFGWMDTPHNMVTEEPAHYRTEKEVSSTLLQALTFIDEHMKDSFYSLPTEEKTEKLQKLMQIFSDEAATGLAPATILRLI